jgi:sterol desaturase/sphingolipid hydroxylase (fatty acid hydroxylase superfamily)
MVRKPLPPWVTAPLAIGAFLLLTILERRRPLRRHVEPKRQRAVRNLAVGAMSGVVIQLAEMPAIRALCRTVEARRWGLLQAVDLPLWLEIPAAVILMDYTIYIWHILLHRIPLLWRFHVAHHADLDMDASTALRFHFGEELLSVPWRASQAILIGVTPLAFSIWQVAFLVSVLFHHSEVELPVAWERRVNWLVVTPRMHGIHHSIVCEETDSNWSSGLTMWDRLHRTLRLNVPQAEISIGVPAWRSPDAVTLPRIIMMPFQAQSDVWELPGGGKPQRPPLAGNRNCLRA